MASSWLTGFPKLSNWVPDGNLWLFSGPEKIESVIYMKNKNCQFLWNLRENLQETPHISWENQWFLVYFPLNQIHGQLLPDGWWYTYTSEKYESQLGWWHSQYMESHQIHLPNHQPEYMDILGLEHQWFSCRFSMGFQVFLQVFDWKIMGTSFQGPRQVLQQHLVAQPLKVTCNRAWWQETHAPKYYYIRLTNSVYIYMYMYVGINIYDFTYIYIYIYICGYIYIYFT